MFLSAGDTLFFPSVGRLNFLSAYRPGMLFDETANANIVPGLSPSNRDTPVDINDFHVAHAHAHEGALRKTAKQMGVTLVGKLHEYKGCLLAKKIRMPIPSKTHCREASKPLVEEKGCDHGKNREASSFVGETELGDAESDSNGEGVEMVASEADDTEVKSTPFVSGRAISTTSRAGSSVHSEGLADAPATSETFRMVPITSLLRCTPGKQRDLLSTSPDSYARLFSKDVRVLKRDGRKALPKQACYPMRTS